LTLKSYKITFFALNFGVSLAELGVGVSEYSQAVIFAKLLQSRNSLNEFHVKILVSQ